MKKIELKQAQSYIFFGVLTTIVNFVSYVLFAKVFHLDYKLAASLAWIISVVFAFITNKLFVFQSETRQGIPLIKELVSFLFFRVLSYFIDLGSIIVLVEWLKVFDSLAKIIASAVVAIANYFASKYVVFNKTSH